MTRFVFGAMRLALMLAVFGLPLAAARADVRVTFINSFRYTAFDDKADDKRAEEMDAIRKTLEDLGARYLDSGATLKVEVLNIAPVTLTNPGPIAPSQMDLQFTLQRDGKTLQQDRETISDLNNLEDPDGPKSRESLAYEKAMLQDWFVARFVTGRPIAE